MKDIEFVDRGGCPLCASKGFSVHIPFPEIPVVRCSECGFLYSSRIMSPSSMNTYYSRDFGSQRHLKGQIVNARTNAWVITKLVNPASIRTVLDVGTGYGFLLKELRDRFNVQVEGVELSARESSYGNEQLGLSIRNQRLSETGLPENHFDLVTSFEVIEHLPDPQGFVREMARHVKPGGHLLVMTDNFESPVAQALGPGFPKWIPHAHISHFAPKTLARVVEAAGLRVAGALSYTPWELLARRFYFALRGIRIEPARAFQLSSVLSTEMAGDYRLFHFRKHMNRIWCSLTARPDTNGALMFLLAEKADVREGR